MNMTLRQLRYFDVLAEEGHFGRAALACSVSQPALSMQIKELEEGLGALLFERTARQVRLTGFGEQFAKRTREILRSVDELEDLARAAQTDLAGRLRFGIIPTVAPYLLPQIIDAISVKKPTLDLHIRETQTEKLISELIAGRLDMAVLALPVSEPLLEEFQLFSEEFVLVRAAEDAEKPVPDSAMLHEMKLLLLEEGHCFRDQALSFCSIQSTTPREMMDGSSLSTLVQMVGAGMGITLIPEMAVNVETRSADVSTARFKNQKPSRTIGMVWRKSSPLANQLHNIAMTVKDAMPREC
jgi:LysR family hydrogen peroxide-inducible transcriptional activator